MPALPYAMMRSEGMPNGSLNAVVALRAVLPALAVTVCGALCLMASSVIELKAVKLTLGVIGIVLFPVGTVLLNVKLSALPLQRHTPPRPKIRTCVWALSSFSELLAGRSATLSIEVVGSTQQPGQERQSPGNFPQPTFAHEPRLEQTACPCCLQDFTYQTRVAVVPCGHIFCEVCLRAWAVADRANGGVCPLCRVSFELQEP